VYDRQSDELATSGECNVSCMWHVGLHYFLPFSLLTAEERSRHVLSEDVAGILDYFYFLSILVLVSTVFCFDHIRLTYVLNCLHCLFLQTSEKDLKSCNLKFYNFWP